MQSDLKVLSLKILKGARKRVCDPAGYPVSPADQAVQGCILNALKAELSVEPLDFLGLKAAAVVLDAAIGALETEIVEQDTLAAP